MPKRVMLNSRIGLTGQACRGTLQSVSPSIRGVVLNLTSIDEEVSCA